MDPAVQTTQLLNTIGARLIRQRKHLVYELPNGARFVQARTPSDHRSAMNSLKDLQNIIRENKIQIPQKPVVPPLAKEPATAAPPAEQMVMLTPEEMMATQPPPEPLKSPRRIERVLVTPEMAKSWLELNVANRNPSRTHISLYARDMALGRWQYNHQAVIFGKNNVLLDGQNRLMACVKSGVSIETDVVWDADPNCVETIDQQKSRSVGDQCTIMGIADPLNLSAMSRLVWRFENQLLLDHKVKASVREMKQYMERNADELQEALHAGNRVKKLCSRTVSGTAYFFFARANKAKANEFFDHLADGSNLYRNHPVLRLRERLINFRRLPGYMLPQDLLPLFIKAWNFFIANKACGCLKFTKDEDFPKINS